MTFARLIPLLVLATLGSACQHDPAHADPPASHQDVPKLGVGNQVSPRLEATYPDECFTDAVTLSFEDVIVTKRSRHALVDGVEVELSYAVLSKAGRTVRTFDGLHHPRGNQTDVGICSLLGTNAHQLVVEQRGPRNWLHWIVDLDAGGRVIFDGQRWHVDRELAIVDLDGDGVFEILQTVTAYWHLFSSGSAGTTGAPSVVFAYDTSELQYLPAPARFADSRDKLGLALPDVHSSDGVLAETLRLLYLGRENEAWALFDHSYISLEKRHVKQELRHILETEPVYAFLWGTQSN